MPTGPLHPELALTGVLVAVAVALLTWRRADRALAVAAVAAAVVLVVALDASPWLIVAVAVAAVGEPLPTGAWVGMAALVAVTVTAATVADGPGRVVLVVAVSLLALAGRRLPGSAHPVLSVALSGGVLAALWAGGPDTEATLLSASVLLPVALVAIREGPVTGDERPSAAAGPQHRSPRGWAPALVLVAWVAVEAYRGRPTGLGAAAIALTGPVALALAVRAPAPGRSRVLLIRQAVAVAAWVTAAVVAARTIGDDQGYRPGWWLATAIVAVVLASGWLLGSRRPDQPRGPGRPAAASRRS